MSFTTIFAASLPQDLVNICASYIWPPELDFMATYRPADARAAEIFARFAVSYEASATWDLQAGIDPNDPQSKGKGKAAIQKRYEEFNAYINQKNLTQIIGPLIPAGTNVFRSHALMQGVVIGRAVKKGHWDSPIFKNGLGPQLLLQLTCCPVYALATDGATEELSRAFYGPGLLSPGGEVAAVQAIPTASSYSTLIQTSHIYGWYVEDDGLAQLYLDHGGFQDLGTLETNFKRLIAHFKPLTDASSSSPTLVPMESAQATAAAPPPSTPVDIMRSLGLFQRHFRNVMLALDNASSTQDNKAVSKFLFKGLRDILELPPSSTRELLARVFREELVRRNFLSEQELHKKYLWYSEPFNALDMLEVVTDFVGHLSSLERNKQQQHGSGGAPVAISSLSVDEDENTQGYLSLIRRLFQEVITPMGNGTPDRNIAGEVRSVLFDIIRKVCREAPSCQAACVLFTLTYNEIRRRNLREPNGELFNGQALKSTIWGMENPALVQLFLEIAAKEEELNPLRAIHDPNTAAFDRHFHIIRV